MKRNIHYVIAFILIYLMVLSTTASCSKVTVTAISSGFASVEASETTDALGQAALKNTAVSESAEQSVQSASGLPMIEEERVKSSTTSEIRSTETRIEATSTAKRTAQNTTTIVETQISQNAPTTRLTTHTTTATREIEPSSESGSVSTSNSKVSTATKTTSAITGNHPTTPPPTTVPTLAATTASSTTSTANTAFTTSAAETTNSVETTSSVETTKKIETTTTAAPTTTAAANLKYQDYPAHWTLTNIRAELNGLNGDPDDLSSGILIIYQTFWTTAEVEAYARAYGEELAIKGWRSFAIVDGITNDGRDCWSMWYTP